jgi:hypothetical protein
MNIQSIHQIEMTSRCNLRCRYCVHPTMARSKEDMAEETWRLVLAWVRLFCKQGTQGEELNLCGIGESTMHPRFGEMVLEAREAVGPSRKLVLATNGVGLTEDHALAMRYARMKVWVSLHRPEKAGPAVELLRRYGVFAGSSSDPSLAAVDWAGQVKWHVSTPVKELCPWLSRGWAMVASNGDVLSCCFDGSGVGKLGTVWEDVGGMKGEAYALCGACHHEVPR